MTKDTTPIADDATIERVTQALEGNGFAVQVVENKEAAKDAVEQLVPKGAEVFTNTSATLDEAGISDLLNGSDYESARDQMMTLYADPSRKQEMKRIASAPEYALGSVHALTEDGKLLIASASGSQIPNEAFGAENVVFVVGAQKIVKDLSEGLERIEQHVVPLEDVRARAVYGQGTSFNKLLVINKENPGRITVVIVKDSIGF